MVKVGVYGRLRSITDKSEVEVRSDVKTLRDLLLELKEKFGEDFYKDIVDEVADNIKIGIILTVNGVGVALEKGLETEIKKDDKIYIDSIGFIPLEGGG